MLKLSHIYPQTLSLPTHVCVAVIGLSGVFGAAVEETVGGRFCHSVGEVVDLHFHVATEARHEEKEKVSQCDKTHGKRSTSSSMNVVRWIANVTINAPCVSVLFSVPGHWLLAAAPVDADVRRWEGGGRDRGAGLVTVRGGAVALIGRHTITAVAVEPWKQQQSERWTIFNC